MTSRLLYLIPLALCTLLLCSCSSKRDYGKETFPVTGEVYVDGQPAAELSITLHPVDGLDAELPSFSSTFTKDDGTFSVSTFEEGDGVPAGEYYCTFRWGKLNTISMSYDDSKLKGKYSNPNTSEIKVTVTEGQPTDVGRIELTTKR